MTLSDVEVSGRTYRCSMDDSVQGPLAVWAVVAGRALDELLLAPPSSSLRLDIDAPGLVPKLGVAGRFGLVNCAQPSYPPLFAPGFALRLTLSADRYVSRSVRMPIARTLTTPVSAGDTVLTLDDRSGCAVGQRWLLGAAPNQELVTVAALGPGPTQITLGSALTAGRLPATPLVPAALTTLELGDVLLRPSPVALRGRVMSWAPSQNAFVPVATADVRVSHVWRRQADLTNDSAKEALRLISLSPGLYRERAVGEVFTPLSEASVPADDKRLTRDARPGDSTFFLSNALGLATGTLLRLDREHPDVSETLSALDVMPSGSAQEPAQVMTAQLGARVHARGVSAEHVTATPSLAPKTIQTEARAGDSVLFLSDVTWASAPVFARVGAGIGAEYQRVASYSTTTDAFGYFDLPPIARVAGVRVAVTPPAAAMQTLDLQPDYRAEEQWLDVKLS